VARKMLTPHDFEYGTWQPKQPAEEAIPQAPEATAQEPTTGRRGACRLSDKARKLLIQEIVGRFEEYVRVEDIKIRWCDLILRQAREVAKYLRKETTKYEGFYLRW